MPNGQAAITNYLTLIVDTIVKYSNNKNFEQRIATMIKDFTVNESQLKSWNEMLSQLGSKHSEIIKALIDLGGFGSVEMIATKLSKLNYVVSPRVTELHQKGLLFDSGDVTKNESTGRTATVWTLFKGSYQ